MTRPKKKKSFDLELLRKNRSTSFSFLAIVDPFRCPSNHSIVSTRGNPREPDTRHQTRHETRPEVKPRDTTRNLLITR